MKSLILLFFLISYITNGFCDDNITTDNTDKLSPSPVTNNTMTVMTLNSAHGRKNSFHQIFLGKEKIQNNLNAIVGVINREKPHVVALQETDGASFWSGRFNHVEYMANKTDLNNFYQGYHVDGFGLHYGTALLSKEKQTNAISQTFNNHSIISLTKGFVLTTTPWPNKNKLNVDIVSIHLDFLLDSVRHKQLKQLVDVINRRDNPVIIMGDLNTESNSKAINFLVTELNLSLFLSDQDRLITYHRFNKRLDWILISEEMEFVSYKVISDELSDHNATVAEIKINITE